MYRFQIIAHTQMGESIGLVGSTLELGEWEVTKCLRLRTSKERYPVWWIDTNLDLTPFLDPSNNQRIEYKYLRFGVDDKVEWESLGPNRWLPLEPVSGPSTIIVDDGAFGYVQPWPYGYWDAPEFKLPLTKAENGLKILVMGSSVALGCSAWLLRGWAYLLEQTLHQKYGHQLVNASVLGANVTTTIERFSQVVALEKPDIVIIALSLGNEGLAYCPPHERPAVQRRFESGLQQLVKMTQDFGALPILGSVYPHGDYSADHYWLVQDTHKRMKTWGVPLLDWLKVLDNGQGLWQPGLSFDPAHPNTEGHRLMYEAINLSLFALNRRELAKKKQLPRRSVTIYKDNQGFHVLSDRQEKSLRIVNGSKHCYTISPSWEELQISLQKTAGLMPGIYLAQTVGKDAPLSFSVRDDGTIETPVNITPSTDIEYRPALEVFSPTISQIVFYDGHLAILKQGELLLQVINESDHEYNIQPMWKEVCHALKGAVSGVYTDVVAPEMPFRTMMIGKDGLESRVKVPPKSSVLFQYQCRLSDISRVAILPLGDRCAIRMVLHKMEYDGPAYPFDLTRTTNLSDVADMIENGFSDMWNPNFLHYNYEAGRIYHSKWTGLSFAHEVEDTEDPVNDMSPIYERMRVRYGSRAQRFWYTLHQCDEVLFIRTGVANQEQVKDLVNKLEQKCQGKPFRILLISPQSSEEFAGLSQMLHYDLHFNPDRMYEDLSYWMHCTEVMRSILDSLGVSSKNLFWCPSKIPIHAVSSLDYSSE